MVLDFREIKTYTWFQVAVACLSLFALGWMDNARGPFFPLLLENTSSSSSEGSMFFALASFTAILSSALASRVIALFGLKALLLIGGALMTASPFGLILYPTVMGSLVTAFLFGASLGLVAVGQNVLVGQIENEEFKRRFFSLLHCFYALAAMTAPLTVLLLKSYLLWNCILVAVSFLSLPFMFMVFFLKPESANEKYKEASSIELTPPKWGEASSFLWVLFMSFYVSSELILSTRMVVLVQSFNQSFESASHHLFYFFFFMLFSRLLFFLFQFKSSTMKVLSVCVLGGILSTLLGYLASPFFFAVVGGFMGPVFPTVMEELSRAWPRRFDTIVSRVISLSSFFVVLMHMSVGRLTDLFGVQASLSVVPALLLLAFCVLLYRKKCS